MSTRTIASTELAGPRKAAPRPTRGTKASNKRGAQSMEFVRPPVIAAAGTVVGPTEGAGPLAGYFDKVTSDETLGQRNWEDAELQLMEQSIELALKKASIQSRDVDMLFAGDLQNQITCCNFAARDLDIPYAGLFNACATFSEGLMLGSMALDGQFASQVVVATCSHNKTAERQYRSPVELGTQRPPTAQWTVTGAGAVVLVNDGALPGARITHATMGRVVDIGVKNPFDMGSAMAPAAVATIRQHFEDLDRRFDDYDAVITGDLAAVGSAIARDLFDDAGLAPGGRYQDCGVLMYDPKRQDVHAGGSGAACSSTVFGGYILNRLLKGTWKRVLFAATGALLSPTSYQQGNSIPTICHAVAVEFGEGG